MTENAGDMFIEASRLGQGRSRIDGRVDHSSGQIDMR